MYTWYNPVTCQTEIEFDDEPPRRRRRSDEFECGSENTRRSHSGDDGPWLHGSNYPSIGFDQNPYYYQWTPRE